MVENALPTTTVEPLREASVEAEVAPDDEPAPAGAAETARRWAVPSLVIAATIGALDIARTRFQHSQTFLPEKYPNGLWQPESYGVPAEDVWFQSEDGGDVHGWWIRHPRARGTVLFCHGNAGNISSQIGVYKFLRRTRMNVFAFDYRGYGRSGGSPSEKGVFADTRGAHDALVEQLDESPARIILFGHSLGGAIAIDCARHRSAAGLVVQSSFSTLRDMARERFPSWPLHVVARNQFRSLDKVRELSLPKLFIHGTSDETIPHHIGRRLYEEAGDPKEWYSVPYAGHSDVHRYGGLRYFWKLGGFMRRSLRQAAAGPLPGSAGS